MNFWKLLFGIFLFFVETSAIAQQNPDFGIYYFNKGLYNPSFTGNSKFIEANFRYYKLWANIDDSPSLSSFSLYCPTSENVSFGVALLNEKSVLFTNTSMLATYGYKVPIGYQQHLKFGLSAGAGINSFDDANVNTDDPSIAMAMQNKMNFQAQFGIHYRNKNLELGFSLPRINFSNSNTLGYEIPAENLYKRMGVQQFSASYKLPLKNTSFLFESGLVYRNIPSYQNQIEVLGIFHYKDMISVGASFLKDVRTNAFLSFKVSNNFSFGYSYGMAPIGVPGFTGGAHEIQAKIFLKKDSKKKKNPTSFRGNRTRKSTHRLYNTRKKVTRPSY